jgi:DNA-binding CsgD family transcriptional regulator
LGKRVPRQKSAFVLSNTHRTLGPLLPALFESPVMGVALLDSQFRFRAINAALAAMNALPVASHIGKKLRYVLGTSAPIVEDMVQQVLETGEPIFNRELTAKLPGREDVGHWIETYLPVRDFENRVTEVAAFVVELTGLRNLEHSLNPLIGNLLHVSASLKTEVQFFETTGGRYDRTVELLPRAIELIDDCVGYARTIAGSSHGCFSANAPNAERDGDKAGRIAANKADINTQSSGEDWRRRLSRRESEALKLLADCKSNKDVANEMNISVRTAETYRARVMMKLDLPSIGHLIRFAVRNNIIKP